MTIYQAIYDTPEAVIFVAYEPGPDGAIFIQSVSIEPRPRSLFQLREEQRRRKPRQTWKQAGLLDEQEA